MNPTLQKILDEFPEAIASVRTDISCTSEVYSGKQIHAAITKAWNGAIKSAVDEACQLHAVTQDQADFANAMLRAIKALLESPS